VSWEEAADWGRTTSPSAATGMAARRAAARFCWRRRLWAIWAGVLFLERAIVMMVMVVMVVIVVIVVVVVVDVEKLGIQNRWKGAPFLIDRKLVSISLD
jgi:hypothetical protein